MTLVAKTKAKARAYKTIIVQASLTIVTYNCQIILYGTGDRRQYENPLKNIFKDNETLFHNV
jgi:hypothetical protein